MNFSSDSVKHESKNQNEDFYFDLETPRGHFFAVVDFDTHDFANLNATLKGKLETIVSSFVSLSRFSADLFLGFLAKEINNFLHNLKEQAGGPQLVASAALCLLSGNRLTYFLCGNVGISIHNAGRVLPLQAGESEASKQLEKLGRCFQETPLTEAVQTFTLEDNDVALIMTEGLESAFESQALSSRLGNVDSSDAIAIRDALMQASVAAQDDRTLLVIAGPYERYVDPVLSDLSKAVISLEARLDALANGERPKGVAPADDVSSQLDEEVVRRLEGRLIPQIELLKDELRGKVNSIDLLELDEKVKSFDASLAGKADKADVLGLQSELLKLSVAADATPVVAKAAPEQSKATDAIEPADYTGPDEPKYDWQRSFLLKVAGIVLVIGFASAFVGAWLQSRLMRRTANTVAPVAAVPFPTIATQPSPSRAEQPVSGPTEIVTKPGDSLKKLAEQYSVTEQTIMELNPTVTRWGALQADQKILVPATAVALTSPPTAATNIAGGTIEVIVGPGDSLNKFAQRYGTTPARIRELNPQITNWPSIQIGQKVLMPTPPSE
jgi:LysM repeat protein